MKQAIDIAFELKQPRRLLAVLNDVHANQQAVKLQERMRIKNKNKTGKRGKDTEGKDAKTETDTETEAETQAETEAERGSVSVLETVPPSKPVEPCGCVCVVVRVRLFCVVLVALHN